MAHPTAYTSRISIGLPSGKDIKAVIGQSYNGDSVLNVIKMMSGRQDMYPATVGFIKSLFQVRGLIRAFAR